MEEISTQSNSENPVLEKKSPLATNLLRFAWVVEVFAVLTGLLIAVMIGIDTLDKILMSRPIEERALKTQDMINTIIAALPFVLVAVVELAKIPVAQAAYNTINKPWKTTFFATLILLALITFETTLNGFERNFSNLTFVIEKFKDQLDTSNAKIAELERQKLNAEELTAETIEARYNGRRLELTTDRDSQVNQLTDRIAELKASVKTERTQALQRELKLVQDELAQVRKDRTSEIQRLIDRNDSQMDSATAEVEKKRQDLKEAIEQFDNKIRNEKAAKLSSLDNAGLFESETRIRKEYDDRIKQYESERRAILSELNKLSVSDNQNSLQQILNQKTETIDKKYSDLIETTKSKISNLNDEIAKSISLVEADIKTSVDSLYQQQKTTESKFGQQLAENNAERDRQYLLLKGSQESINQINTRLTELNNLRVELRNQINAEVSNNQIYRITRSWTDAESSADISRGQVAATATVWFGSLAFVVAFTGILLALASCVISDEKKGDKKENKRSRFAATYRRYLAHKHKVLKQPKIITIEIEKPIVKEVIKEVPVDKVVFKEVTKEIIKNRLIHVPVYTNDKSLLQDPDQ
jgi:hypothetical protein